MLIASPFSQRNKKETGFRKLSIEENLKRTSSTLRTFNTILHCEIAPFCFHLVHLDHAIQNVHINMNLFTTKSEGELMQTYAAA